MIDQLKTFFENNGFNVVERIADRLGVRASKLRIMFIYLAFVTLSLAFGLYLVFAFFLWVKDCIIKKRKSVFDL